LRAPPDCRNPWLSARSRNSNRLDVRLLQRSTRSVTPTPAGYEFAQRCGEILTATAVERIQDVTVASI
jgi:hypothetical protein